MKAGRAALVDVRSPAEFTGEILAPPGLPETRQRGGYIPGAKSIPGGKACNEDGTFKSADDLRSLFGGVGVTPDRPVIAYCRIGERWSRRFVLKHLLGYRTSRTTTDRGPSGAPVEQPSRNREGRRLHPPAGSSSSPVGPSSSRHIGRANVLLHRVQ